MANELVQGLGWFVRRTADGQQWPLAEFYERALGMRGVRPPPKPPLANKMLWTGDIAMFELSVRTAGAEGEARQGDTIPVFRARNFDGARDRIRAAGGTLHDESPGMPRYMQFKDPDGFLFGITEPPAGSPYPSDQMADALWQRGAVELPGIEKFGPELQDIASIIVKVADPTAMANFYAEAIGLDLYMPPGAGGAVLGLGRTVSLTLRPGGQRRDAPDDRQIIPDVWILRVRDIKAMTARLKSKGVNVVNEMTINGGALVYAVDPEGHLFGLQQRTLDLYKEGVPVRIEDKVVWALG